MLLFHILGDVYSFIKLVIKTAPSYFQFAIVLEVFCVIFFHFHANFDLISLFIWTLLLLVVFPNNIGLWVWVEGMLSNALRVFVKSQTAGSIESSNMRTSSFGELVHECRWLLIVLLGESGISYTPKMEVRREKIGKSHLCPTSSESWRNDLLS